MHRFQIMHTAPTTLTVRLQTEPGTGRKQVWAMVRARLADYLTRQGLPAVNLELAAEAPMVSPRGGKLRHVLALLAVQRSQQRPALVPIEDRGSAGGWADA